MEIANHLKKRTVPVQWILTGRRSPKSLEESRCFFKLIHFNIMKVTKMGNLSAAADAFLQGIEAKQSLVSHSDSAPFEQVNMVMANFSEPLSEDDHSAIKEALNNEKVVFYFENVKAEHFPEGAFISTDADLCVMCIGAGGRVQHSFASGLNGQSTPIPENRPKVEVVKEMSEEEAKNVKINHPEQVPAEEMNIPAKEGDDVGVVLGWAIEKLGNFQRDDMVNASLLRGSYTIEALSYNSNMNGKPTQCGLYASYDYELAAVLSPTRSKRLTVTSASSYVRVNGLSIDTNSDKGDCTSSGYMLFYPGDTYTFDKNAIHLPKRWRIVKVAPETPNSDNSYTRTTGWSIGAEAGGEISKDPKVAVKLSATYSASNSYTESFQDFTALNFSTEACCHWEYAFTKARKNWEDLFDGFFSGYAIRSLPLLAQSTMYLKNEVVYDIPADDNSRQMFICYIAHETMYIYSHWNYGCIPQWANHAWGYFNIDLGSVRFPELS